MKKVDCVRTLVGTIRPLYMLHLRIFVGYILRRSDAVEGRDLLQHYLYVRTNRSSDVGQIYDMQLGEVVDSVETRDACSRLDISRSLEALAL